MTIKWLPVVGWEHFYEVSDDGQVRSLDRYVKGAANSIRSIDGKMLSQTVGPKGHLFVDLYKENRRRHRYVHQLVLEAFVGPRPHKYHGCHKNGVPTDNRIDNLRWDTASENLLDRVRHGVHHQTRKTHCLRGHEFNFENTIINSRGYRRCRACTQAHDLKRRITKREHGNAGN